MPFGSDKPHSWLREDDSFDRHNKPGASDWFDLSDDVRFDKPNNRHDAFKVESLLGYGGYMDMEKSGGPMGLATGRLEKPIKEFQAKNGLKVDGLLKPGGPTITKMKELYGGVFGGTPAPTPAMVDANAEVTHAGEDGFLYDKGPSFGVRPNKRLDGKAHLMEYERWNREWARGSGNDPTSLAPEYESYIRDLDDEHGHDPGLIFARDLVQQVGKFHGDANGAELAKALAVRLSDRPDLQRELLGGEVPKAPPIGMFKPGGEERIKTWIDNDRIANGVAPRYMPSQNDVPVLRTASHAAPASQEAAQGQPDPANLLEYGPNFGLPEPPQQAPSAGEVDPNQMTPVPRPAAPPQAGVVSVPVYHVPTVEEEVDRLDEADRQRRVWETVDQEELNRRAQADPSDPASPARFTEGIITERRHPPQAEPAPPPPAPVPPRPSPVTRTENAWIVENPASIVDRARDNGGWIGIGPDGKPSRECVGLVQAAVPGVGHTSTWRPGDRVQPADPMRPIIPPGTPIATFDRNGRYPNRPTGNHAGIFDGYGEKDGRAGIWVIDQHNDQRDGGADRRFYPFERPPGQGGYRAGQFSVIRPSGESPR